MNRTSISYLKAKAKDQLLGNYGIATGSFALLFVLIYAIMMVIMSAFTFNFVKDGQIADRTSLSGQLITQLFSMVISALSVTLSVGYVNIICMIADGKHPVISDLFHVFRNHPDKVIIISLVMTGAQFVLLLPYTFVTAGVSKAGTEFDGKRFLLGVILYIAGLAVSFVIDLMLAMCFMIYLDDPETGVADIMKGSVSMMKGNKLRYFYMLLTFIGYGVLIVLSLGIASLWVVPYQTMTAVEFYRDLKNGPDIEEAGVEYL